MVVYYINKVSENLADYRYPIKDGDICMLYDGEVIKTIYIDSERDTDSIWRDFKFIDSKSLKSYQFPTSDSILCAPIGEKHAIGNTGLLTQLVKECKGEWLLDFLNETSSILSGFVDYWDLEVLRRLTGDDEVKITYEEEDALSEFIDRPKEDEIDIEDDDIHDDDEYTDFLPKSYDVMWFCQSVLKCIEDQLDKRDYQILYDTLSGESRKSIAEKYRLTQERIRQIVVKTTKLAKELFIEQRRTLDETKKENSELRVQLNLLSEKIVGLKAQLPMEIMPPQENIDESSDADLAELLETPINNIRLNARASNILQYMGAKTFADIPQIESKARVLEMRNSGRKTTRNILRMLEDFHLTFGMSYTTIVDGLKSNDWRAAKRKWIRGGDNHEEMTDIIAETRTKEPPISDIEETIYDEEVVSSQMYTIENKANRCYIIDSRGERVFSAEGQLISLDKAFYKINYRISLVSMNIIQEDSKGGFSLGRRILSAQYYSPIYRILDEQNYLTQFKAVKYDEDCDEYYVQVDDRWYGSSGYYADLNWDENNNTSSVTSFSEPQTASIEEESSDIIEVEHVFLDSRGEIIDKVVSNSTKLSESNLSTENRKGKPWTKEEEEVLVRLFNQGKDIPIMADLIGRTEVAVKSRLGKLGLIEYTYGQEEKESNNIEETKKAYETQKRNSDKHSILKNPLYAVRKQAILRAMSFFRLPAKIKDIARTISRTAWRDSIKEDEVEDIINTMSDVESVDGGYILRKKN